MITKIEVHVITDELVDVKFINTAEETDSVVFQPKELDNLLRWLESNDFI